MAARNRGGSGGESKQGLVITLVLFILLTLGLGVATYFGYSEQDTYKVQKDEALKKYKTMEDERNWFRFQAGLYRLYVGKTQNLDLERLQLDKEKFDQGTLGTGQKDLDDTRAIVKALEAKTKLGWNPAAKKPQKTYEDLLAEQDAEKDKLRKQAEGLQTALVQAQGQVKDSEEKLDEARKDFDKRLAELKDKFGNEFKKDREDVRRLAKEADDNNRKKEELAKRADDLQKKLDTLTRKGQKLEEDLRVQKDAARDAERRLDESRQKVAVLQEHARVDSKTVDARVLDAKALEALHTWREDWRIVSLDPRGQMAYINLGWADNVKPQLTFSVHAAGRNGRPEPTVKGALEVVSVLDRHLARARVTSVRDSARDPILKGDMLFNPSWNPNYRTHVAVAGLVDLTGEGRDSTADFLRELGRQNIAVDAWVDPQSFTVKGKGITPNTKYVILAGVPETRGVGKSTDDATKVQKAITELRQKANQIGVTIIPLRRYLEMIGYRVPSAQADQAVRPPAVYGSR